MPHRSRKLRSGIISTLALLAFVALPVVGQGPLTVTAVNPNGALPGEMVDVSGTGFGQVAEDLFVWTDTGARGFPFEVTRAEGQRLDALLGPVPRPATGSVKVWKGSRYTLADQVVLTQGRLLSASETQVFVRQETASGPAFSAFDVSPGTLGSVLAQEQIRIDLAPFDTGKPEVRVRVTAVIETGGEPGNTDGQAHGGVRRQAPGSPWEAASAANQATAGPAWAATLTVKADAGVPTPEGLAAALADVLQAQLGSLGLMASAEGPVLVVDHSLGIDAGFLNLTY